MWIDSGIHAREWIAPAVGTWMLNELVEKSADHPELLDNLDWYFLPSHNPDGYRKSRDDDRFWRKTTTQYDGDACQGTDANRNWDYHWGEEAGNLKDYVFILISILNFGIGFFLFMIPQIKLHNREFQQGFTQDLWEMY